MADTRNTTLTIAGMNLLTKCQLGKELHFTRVMMGDGKVPEGQNIKDMTDMVSPRLKLPIGDKRLDGAGTAVMECILKNAELEQGFVARELGIYANDPDSGEEVLYAYRNTGDYSEYIPAAASGEAINFVYSVITVVGQTENVTVVIEEGLGGVSRAEFYDHQNNVNPHPNFLKIGSTVQNCLVVFVGEQNNPRRLDRISVEDLRGVLLGAKTFTLPIINGRLSQIETELANIGIRLDGPPNIVVSSKAPSDPHAVWLKVDPQDDEEFADLIFRDLDLSNMAFYDDFFPVQEIETLKISVNAITAGSRTIGVASLDGVKPGQWYTVTDGVNSEDIQVKSSSKNDGVLRIICTKDIQNTYVIDNTVILRTTADIATRVVGLTGKGGIRFNTGESMVSLTKEFAEDGISALAYAQCMIRHEALKDAKLHAYVTFSGEVRTVTDIHIGIGTGARQTLQLPDTGVDYNTIEIKVDGVKYPYISANTEPERPEVTLTVAEGAVVTASYKCGYGRETWHEMEQVSQENYGNTGHIATKFEFAMPGENAATRTAIKFTLERGESGESESTIVYAIATGWAKAPDAD